MSAAAEIRRAVAADAAAIAALHGASFSHAWPAADVAVLIEAPGGLSLLAESGGVATGFLLGRHAADEAEIVSIAVDPAWRRRGVGELLLRRFVAACAALRVARLFIEVAAADAGACAFYRAAGFQDCGRRRDYYRDRPAGAADALLMRRDIADPAGGELDRSR